MDADGAVEGPAITGFLAGGFRVGDRVVTGGLKLTPTTAQDWHAPAFAALAVADLTDLVTSPPPEFILLGTGATTRRPHPALVRALEDAGVGVEVMDSRAAARAWGVLRSEGRAIAAALLPLDA